MKFDKHKCPECGDITFSLTRLMTTAECDSCGFNIDYDKIDFMKHTVDMIKQIKKAIIIPIELDEDEE